MIAIPKCNISFKVDYSSTSALTAATYSYKLKNTSNIPTTGAILLPLTASNIINIPADGLANGEYDLVVTLTSGSVTTSNTSTFKIGNCSGNVFTIQNPLSKNIQFTPGEPQGQQTDSFNLSELTTNLFNSTGNALAGIKIYSLPDRGTLTDQGWDIPVAHIITKTQIDNSAFEFWAKGSDATQPNGDYSTVFTYTGVDTAGNESNLVTFTIIATEIKSANPLDVVLTKIGTTTLRATISGGVDPYKYDFTGNTTGDCGKFNIADPSGETNELIVDVPFTYENGFAGVSYNFSVAIQDSMGDSVNSNLSFGACLIEGTKVITNKGEKNIEDLSTNELILDRYNSFTRVTSIKKSIVGKVININKGLLISSEWHIHLVKRNNDVIEIQADQLQKGDKLIDADNNEIAINSLEEILERTNVVNISTVSKTYIANGILTHNKKDCAAPIGTP